MTDNWEAQLESDAYDRGRADERERCAKIAEDRAGIWRLNRIGAKASEAEAIAAEIRKCK